MGNPPTGTVTFVFSDIEDSTRSWAEHPMQMSEVVARHDVLMRQVADRFRGYVFTTAGDSFGVAFGRAGDAAAFAAAVQDLLAAEEWVSPVELRVRIGMHTGEAEARDGDYFGPSVNLAARICDAGHGGQILASVHTANLLDGTEVELSELGAFHLKGVSGTQQIFQIGTGVFAPLRTAAAEPGNVPRRVSRLIGREQDIDRVEQAMANGPLTTVIGPGGIGKTCLALEVARRRKAGFGDGVWLVELAPLGSPDQVARAVADVVGVKEQPGRTLEQSLLASLAGREALIVLDNCEHVIDGVAALASAVVEACPEIALLATSREGLAIQGEGIVALPPLDAATDAVALFAERARAADPSFELAEHLESVEEVCRRLDGVPLAVELAAVRVRTIAPAELATRLDDHLRLLSGGRRSAVERHRTLRSTIEWSYELLTPEEQNLFQQLSIFAGEFDLRAVETVGATDGLDPVDVDHILTALVDRSMVVSRSGHLGQRFRLLETMRQFAAEELANAGGTDAAAMRHAAHLAAYLEDLQAMLAGVDEIEGVLRANEVWDDVRAALNWSCAVEDLDLAMRLALPLGMELYWRSRNELVDWFEQVLALPGVEGHLAYPLLVSSCAGAYRWLEDCDRLDDLMERHPVDTPLVRASRLFLDRDWSSSAVEFLDAAEDCDNQGFPYIAACCRYAACSALLYAGDMRVYADEVEKLYESLPDVAPSLRVTMLWSMITAATGLGERDRAAECLEASMAIDLPPGTMSLGAIFQAQVDLDAGRASDAVAGLREYLHHVREVEQPWLVPMTAYTLSRAFIALDRPREVARLIGYYRESDRTYETGDAVDIDAYLETRLGNDLAEELARGAALDSMGAVDEMLAICRRVMGELEIQHPR